MLENWPDSKMLFVFQHPGRTLSSVDKKMLKVEPDLYKRYYKDALDSNDPRVFFFDLEKIFTDPQASKKALSEFCGKTPPAGFQLPSRRNKENDEVLLSIPMEVMEVYEQLKKRAVNRGT
jgi:hypothetical protein